MTNIKCSDFLIDLLRDNSVHDVFGLPGGVILDFLESVDRSLNARLVFHEQSAVFSAIGYARGNGSLGVAYATRGPGVTNTLTSVADAYYDSVPVLIITGHSGALPKEGMRTLSDQEIDIVSIFSPVTKEAVRVDTVDQFVAELPRLIELAKSGRPGPVLVDVKSSIWNQFVPENSVNQEVGSFNVSPTDVVIRAMKEALIASKRPVLLLGDGFRGKPDSIASFCRFSSSYHIPILTGRFSQDLFKSCSSYSGYIGSHGLRSGNYILSKSDLLIVVGNRMHYPTGSQSWSPIMEGKNILWIDIDESEFLREVGTSACYTCSLETVASHINLLHFDKPLSDDWIKVCQKINDVLRCYDREQPIKYIEDIISSTENVRSIVCDVGNHEFWVARAYFEVEISTPLIFSKSFGAMGSAIGKAIGLAHSGGGPVLCFVGDQGLMMNIQELHYIYQHELPIKIILMNNFSSGMIRSRQLDSGRRVLQTTIDTGYSVPDFVSLANAFGLKTLSGDPMLSLSSEVKAALLSDKPSFIHLTFPDDFVGRPHLPVGFSPTRMEPKVELEILDYLEAL